MFLNIFAYFLLFFKTKASPTHGVCVCVPSDSSLKVDLYSFKSFKPGRWDLAEQFG